MKLRVGMPLATKNGQQYTNAVVYKIIEGEHRNVVYVLSDFGNVLKYPSEADVLVNYDISEAYLSYIPSVDAGIITLEDLDDAFKVRDRIFKQVELLMYALEGLE